MARAKHVTFKLVRRALGLRERVVEVDGLRWVYLEGGAGPPLVLLHGLGADKDNYLKVAASLSRRHRLIIPDLPGFGDTDRPDGVGYTVSDQVPRLHGFVEKLGLGRFALGGNSMGGFIAGAYGAMHGDRLTGLWLMAPAGVREAAPSELATRLDAGEAPPILARNRAEFRGVLRFVTHKPQRLPGFVVRAMADVQAARYEHHVRVLEGLRVGPSLEDLYAEASIEVPTLVVWGEHDRALHVSGADVLGRILPNVQVRRMTDVGHMPQLEAPGAVVRDFLRFQRSVEA